VTRQLDRGLGRLRAAREQFDRIEVARRDRCDQIGQLDGGHVGRMQRRGETDLVDLAVQRGGNARVGVADVHGKDPRNAVEVASPLYVPVPDALGTAHHERLGQKVPHLAEVEDHMSQHFRRGIAREIVSICRRRVPVP